MGSFLRQDDKFAEEAFGHGLQIRAILSLLSQDDTFERRILQII